MLDSSTLPPNKRANTDFEVFWNLYPRKEGKLDAEKAYAQARKRATADAILAGVMLYAQSCPQERKFQKLPAGWLRAGRWLDELPGVRATQKTDWYEICGQLHNHECGLSRWRHEQRIDIDRIKAGESLDGRPVGRSVLFDR